MYAVYDKDWSEDVWEALVSEEDVAKEGHGGQDAYGAEEGGLQDDAADCMLLCCEVCSGPAPEAASVEYYVCGRDGLGVHKPPEHGLNAQEGVCLRAHTTTI